MVLLKPLERCAVQHLWQYAKELPEIFDNAENRPPPIHAQPEKPPPCASLKRANDDSLLPCAELCDGGDARSALPEMLRATGHRPHVLRHMEDDKDGAVAANCKQM